MTFQIKHTKQNLFGRKFFKILIIFLLILILILVFGVFDSTRSLVSDFFSPFLRVGDYFYKTIGQNCSDEIENDRFNLVDYEAIKYENQKLRETLKIKPEGNFIVATIMARSPQIPLDSLFLDKGTTDGINNGDLVLVGERTLIGKIVETSKNKSTVALNSFAGVVSYGFLARTDESLEVKGVGGGGLEIKVPIDFDIETGDKFMVPGLFTYFAAVVGMTEEDRSSGFKNVLLSLPVNISNVNTVFVEPYSNE